jgi:hypothetical protein
MAEFQKYGVCCPRHTKQIIGIVTDPEKENFDHGFWCPECRCYKFFDEISVRKYLTSIPERYSRKASLKISDSMRGDARSPIQV